MVRDLLADILRNASNHGAFARVAFKVTHVVSSLQEVELDTVSSLAVIQTQLNAAIARAHSAEVVLLNCRVDHVLAATDFLEIVSLALLRQTTDDEVHNLRLAVALFLIVLKGGVTSCEVVARKHSLLHSLGLATRHFEVSWLVHSHLARCAGPLSVSNGLVFAAKDLLAPGLGVVRGRGGFLTADTLLKIVIHFTVRMHTHLGISGGVLEGSHLAPALRSVLLIISLLEHLAVQVLLLLPVGILLADAILRTCHASLGLPIVCCHVSSTVGRLVINDGLFFFISAAKHGTLQVLVLTIARVQLRAHLLKCRFAIDGLDVSVAPVRTLCHEGAVLARLFVHAIDLGTNSVKFTGFQSFSGGDLSGLLFHDFLGRGHVWLVNHGVVVRTFKVRLRVAEERRVAG